MSETESKDEASSAPIEVSNTGPLELLTDTYSLEEMQYLCTEFDSDRGVTIDHIKTLKVNQYMDMVVEQQFGQPNKKDKQYTPESEHLAFDAGRLLADADSILQDEFNGFSTVEDGTDAVCPGGIH